MTKPRTAILFLTDRSYPYYPRLAQIPADISPNKVHAEDGLNSFSGLQVFPSSPVFLLP